MYVYILENENGICYIGSTADITKRLQNHNDKEQKGWTRKRGTWKLIYTEKYETRSEAMKREKYLKSLKSGKRIKQLLNISNIPFAR